VNGCKKFIVYSCRPEEKAACKYRTVEKSDICDSINLNWWGEVCTNPAAIAAAEKEGNDHE
jgi:hypothetical protein